MALNFITSMLCPLLVINEKQKDIDGMAAVTVGFGVISFNRGENCTENG